MHAHVARVAFLAGWLALSAAPLAQTAPAPGKGAGTSQSAPAQGRVTRPAWNELTPAQREALAPLAGMWPTLESDQKVKWLEVARRYPDLSADGKKRVQARMVEFARLTPEQRRTARENFRRAYELSAEDRQERLQKYQEMPADKKRDLANRASANPPRPPRATQTAPKAPKAKPQSAAPAEPRAEAAPAGAAAPPHAPAPSPEAPAEPVKP